MTKIVVSYNNLALHRIFVKLVNQVKKQSLFL
jgi:hypothetical protein